MLWIGRTGLNDHGRFKEVRCTGRLYLIIVSKQTKVKQIMEDYTIVYNLSAGREVNDFRSELGVMYTGSIERLELWILPLYED